MLIIPTITVSKKLQYYKVRKFLDFQGSSSWDSRTFKHQPCFQVLSSLWI